MATIYIAKDIGGTVDWYAPQRPDAGPTVEIVSSSNDSKVAAGTAATLDSVDTTTTSGLSAGATSVPVTSGANIAANRRYLIASSGGQSEMVEVQAISGTTVTLKYPIVYGHANASTFQGTRISYTVASSVPTTEDDHWRAIFSWDLSTVAQPEGIIDFVVTMHPLHCPVTPVDLRAVSPLFTRHLAATTDVNDLIARAWDEVLEILWSQGLPPSRVVGSNKLHRAVVYRSLALCAEQYGADFAGEREEIEKRAAAVLDIFRVNNAAVDMDTDDLVEDHEAGIGSGELSRA